jgi:hypothetical protein
MKIFKTITLPAVLCRCEIWSLTLREENRLRASENRILRRVIWVGHVALKGQMGNLYQIFVGKPEDKRPIGRWA